MSQSVLILFSRLSRSGARITPVLKTLILIGLVGCAYTLKVPKDLAEQIDHAILFEQLKDNPKSHAGKVIELGGQILWLKDMKDGTLLELLQLPLFPSGAPNIDAGHSEGRFMLFHPDLLDATTYKAGRIITAVGEVAGTTVPSIENSRDAYPYLTAKFIHLWPPPRYASPRFYSTCPPGPQSPQSRPCGSAPSPSPGSRPPGHEHH